MKRKIMNQLVDWKQTGNGKTALLIHGARRVGKSYIAEEFAKTNYASYILIDFNRIGTEVTDLFNKYLDDLDTLFLYLSTYYNIKLYPRNSLIIFDEVQMFPRARAALKYMVADGRYDYLETGSLMSIRKNVKDIVIPSEERPINMYPMDFEEFLWALGNETLMPLIRSCCNARRPMGQAMHRKAMTYFRQYMIIGGMPQAVSAYRESRDFEAVDQVKRDILSLYRNDIRKHADGNELEVEAIFDEIPAQLSKHDKKFRLSDIHPNARSRKYAQPFFWLADAMISNHCYNATEPNVGLKMSMERRTMKCFLLDTGLLISHAFDENGIVSEEIYKKLLFDKLSFNGGMLMENVVAQMLTAAGHKLYFYSKAAKDASSRMEIDFLLTKSRVTSRHNISPIEVKSGERYTLSSLNKFRTKFVEQTDTPYVLHTKDLKEDDGIVYLPLYMTPLL